MADSIKHLFRGKFVFKTYSKVMYAYAHSEAQAKMVMCRRIAKKDKVPLGKVLNYFSGDNCSIKVEMEIRDEVCEGEKEII